MDYARGTRLQKQTQRKETERTAEEGRHPPHKQRRKNQRKPLPGDSITGQEGPEEPERCHVPRGTWLSQKKTRALGGMAWPPGKMADIRFFVYPVDVSGWGGPAGASPGALEPSRASRGQPRAALWSGSAGPGLELPSAPRALLQRGEVRDCGRSRQLRMAGSESVCESRTGGRSGRGSHRFGAWAVRCPLGLPWPRAGGGAPFWALGPFGYTGSLLGRTVPGLR
ncbi:hypothetical protein NDU88_002304 [Pleurodeles waltl]|uniref:Uncharacterized protein n=1 Tax=Pleurodeles waltl TaxID=8319 RepID=A0AAV7UYA6_PLEWA|nr:hypothetical protein NDU88_002304 [Pleurodeles waltl]